MWAGVYTVSTSQHKNTFHQSLSGLPQHLISVSQYRCHVKIASLWLAFWSSYIIGTHASQFSWGFCSIVKDCMAPKRCDWAYLCVLSITLQPTETQTITPSLSFLTGETIFQLNVTLNHKTNLKSLGYIWSNCQKYIVWVKIIDLTFKPKIIRILSTNLVSRRYLIHFLP